MARLAEYIDQKPEDWSTALHVAFKDYYAELKDTYDYPEIRKGCEVILGRDETSFIDLFSLCRKRQPRTGSSRRYSL
jgi:hypothetical protein